MSTFHLLVVIVCAFALVEKVSPSTSTSSSTSIKDGACAVCSIHDPKKCCKGLKGDTKAPAKHPDKKSPAGGPSKNANAVVCYFYRDRNCLICKKGDKSARCCIASTNVKDENKEGGPTPCNEYLVGVKRTNKGRDWYNLYPRKNKNSYYRYDEPTDPGHRDLMGLHPGTGSEGCVTVLEDKNNSGSKDCWKKIMEVVEAGSLTYKDDPDYSGFLYVIMAP